MGESTASKQLEGDPGLPENVAKTMGWVKRWVVPSTEEYLD